VPVRAEEKPAPTASRWSRWAACPICRLVQAGAGAAVGPEVAAGAGVAEVVLAVVVLEEAVELEAAVE